MEPSPTSETRIQRNRRAQNETDQPAKTLTKYLSSNQIGIEQQRGGGLNGDEGVVRNKSMRSLEGGAQKLNRVDSNIDGVRVSGLLIIEPRQQKSQTQLMGTEPENSAFGALSASKSHVSNLGVGGGDIIQQFKAK